MGVCYWSLDLKICTIVWFVCDDLVCLDPLCSTLIGIENVKYKNKSSCERLKPEKIYIKC